jgi:isoleucyl-tRNA synthetase
MTEVRKGYAAFDFQGVFQALFNFATVDLSAFYFDIRKDALYCDGDTPRRRAARTVLDILFHRLTTWLAPILVFTMEEVWLERFPARTARSTCRTSPPPPPPGATRRWPRNGPRIRAGAPGGHRALEIQRRDKVIGASLEAAPVVHVADPVAGRAADRRLWTTSASPRA